MNTLYIDFLNILKEINIDDIEIKLRDNFIVIFVSDTELYFSYTNNGNLNIYKSIYCISTDTFDFSITTQSDNYYKNSLGRKIIYIKNYKNDNLYIDSNNNLFYFYDNKKILLDLQSIEDKKINNIIIGQKSVQNIEAIDLSIFNCQFADRALTENFLSSVTIFNENKYVLSNDFVFRNSINLESIIFKDNLISITGEKIFNYCFSLTSIEFPSTLTYINHKSFNHCNKLERIIFNSDNILSDYLLLLSKIPDSCKIYVKDDLYNEYISAEFENKNNRYLFYKISELSG